MGLRAGCTGMAKPQRSHFLARHHPRLGIFSSCSRLQSALKLSAPHTTLATVIPEPSSTPSSGLPLSHHWASAGGNAGNKEQGWEWEETTGTLESDEKGQCQKHSFGYRRCGMTHPGACLDTHKDPDRRCQVLECSPQLKEHKSISHYPADVISLVPKHCCWSEVSEGFSTTATQQRDS